eukprot:TRINITY_DN24949_c0_g1_i1.p3 TRINITY_DN24949_c0_g1~~TRINITY_DN24949_c0_g1_i1.p3  ORF type:complete len:145 (-),score=11.61 TRINITY_DN24949_c0_g1_i1:6-440(-)
MFASFDREKVFADRIAAVPAQSAVNTVFRIKHAMGSESGLRTRLNRARLKVNAIDINITRAFPVSEQLFSRRSKDFCVMLGYQMVYCAEMRAVMKDHAFITVGYIQICLLYTSDAADEEDSVGLGGIRHTKKKKKKRQKKITMV